MEKPASRAVVLTASKVDYGRRTLMRAGVILLVIGLAVWARLLPPHLKWLDMTHSVMADMRWCKLCSPGSESLRGLRSPHSPFERANFLYLRRSSISQEVVGEQLSMAGSQPWFRVFSCWSTHLSDRLRSSALN